MVAYLKEQLDRIDVKAPQDGLAVFDDPNDWLAARSPLASA